MIEPTEPHPSPAEEAHAEEAPAERAVVGLARLAAGTERLLRTCATLDAAALAAPSHLPGWSRAHVLTHRARNADGLRNLLLGARAGRAVAPYPSPQLRDADIEAGAGRPAAALAADVRGSADRLAVGLDRLGAAGPEELDRLLLFGPPRPEAEPDTPARALPYARRREVEIHHVDLGLGYGPRDWPADFVERTLILVHGRSGAVDAVGEPADVLAWRLGRPATGPVRRRDGSDVGEPPPW